MSIIIKQVAVNGYVVGGEYTSRLSTALRLARSAANELTELTGIKCAVVQQIWE